MIQLGHLMMNFADPRSCMNVLKEKISNAFANEGSIRSKQSVAFEAVDTLLRWLNPTHIIITSMGWEASHKGAQCPLYYHIFSRTPDLIKGKKRDC